MLARRLEPDGQGGLAPVPAMRGVSLFLSCRGGLPDGAAQRYRIVRLKEKLGSREHGDRRDRAWRARLACLVGDPEARLRARWPTWSTCSRLSNGVRAAGLMRRARSPRRSSSPPAASRFGRRLIEMPLMRRQLARS
ncbi:MAG: hypothetical protein RML56_06475 [Burkholderiales bacterium]|nr:hypothetical protein [Burkholderiales bacterium]